MKINFLIKAIDNLSISQTHAGAFNENTLDYIPGSAILGVFASKLYPSLSDEESWRLFQNGDTIFSNCYPMESKNDKLYSLLPVPFCLHYSKKLGDYNSSLKSGAVYNCFFNHESEEQLKQLRSGYINSDASISKSVVVDSLAKTAINQKTQTAKDGSLFVIGYIRRNSVFIGSIDGPDELINKIIEVIKVDKGIFRVGKSRGTEFGRIKIELLDTCNGVDSLIVSPNKLQNKNPNQLVLWCLSDIEFFDSQTGMPTNIPNLSNVIVGEKISGNYDYERSFVRTERLRFYNRKRGGYESEKIVVKKGSIITFNLDNPLSDSQLTKIATKGIGLSKQLGFGQVLPNPSWILDTNNIGSNIQLFTPFVITKSKDTKTDNQTSDQRLIKWLQSKANDNNNKNISAENVDSVNLQILKWYELARRTNVTNRQDHCGPSSSQFERILSLTKSSITVKTYHNKISDNLIKNIKMICDSKSDPMGWGIQAEYNGKSSEFGQAYLELIKDITNYELIKHLEKLTKFDPSDYEDLTKNLNKLENKGASK